VGDCLALLAHDVGQPFEALDQTRTALAVLCGAEAPGFAPAPADIAALALPELAPPPAALLLPARPDVRAREAAIAAAHGDIRAARAAFMPSLDLSVEGLAQAMSGGGVLDTAVRAGAAVLVPIFAQGRLTAGLRVAEADQVAAVEDYRQTVLAALAEVENTLTSAAAVLGRQEQLFAQIAMYRAMGGHPAIRTPQTAAAR